MDGNNQQIFRDYCLSEMPRNSGFCVRHAMIFPSRKNDHFLYLIPPITNKEVYFPVILLGILRQYVSHLSAFSDSFTLLDDPPPQSVPFEWVPEQKKVLQQIQSAM